MHCSIFTVCLALFVAVCSVSAQWNTARLDCRCHPGDRCVEEFGELMCRATGSRSLYAPLRQTVLGGQRLRNTRLNAGLNAGLNLGLRAQAGLNRGVLNQAVANQALANQVVASQALANRAVARQALANQAVIGQTYVDNGLVGAGLIGATQTCCLTRDYPRCIVKGYTGPAHFIGSICNKFYFDGNKCVPTRMYSECANTIKNAFVDEVSCLQKCSAFLRAGY